MWASEPEDVGAAFAPEDRRKDREDQWPKAFENRDGTAVDVLAKWVSMATS